MFLDIHLNNELPVFFQSSKKIQYEAKNTINDNNRMMKNSIQLSFYFQVI